MTRESKMEVFRQSGGSPNETVAVRNKQDKDGGNIGGSGIHFPSAPGKYLADLRSRANSQQYSSIYKD